MTYRFSPEPLVETSYFERPGALGSRAAGQTIVHAINERFDGIVRPRKSLLLLDARVRQNPRSPGCRR